MSRRFQQEGRDRIIKILESCEWPKEDIEIEPEEAHGGKNIVLYKGLLDVLTVSVKGINYIPSMPYKIYCEINLNKKPEIKEKFIQEILSKGYASRNTNDKNMLQAQVELFTIDNDLKKLESILEIAIRYLRTYA